MAGKGDLLPVSAFPVDGTFPSATTRWEKRNIALEIPVWDESASSAASARSSARTPSSAPRSTTRPCSTPPPAFKHAPVRNKPEFKGQVHPPGLRRGLHRLRRLRRGLPQEEQGRPRSARPSTWRPAAAARAGARELGLLPREPARWTAPSSTSATSRTPVHQPLFEFSGACAGCGETPYLKLLTQLFGDRAIIANATGCSSIYGGNLPTTPYPEPRRPRPGLVQLALRGQRRVRLRLPPRLDQQKRYAEQLVAPSADLGDDLVDGLSPPTRRTRPASPPSASASRPCKLKLAGNGKPEALNLITVADYLIQKSVWIVGGDGWAYDIGYGGLDHVLASGAT
jgi:pyruvate-ferredoxin/flavodoxin oxidoreductase